MLDKKVRSGVVCIIGRPSAGKSTFLNSVCGGMVSIVSTLPQTTRSSVRGILTAEQGQIIFIDTPGYHISEKKNKPPYAAYCGKPSARGGGDLVSY